MAAPLSDLSPLPIYGFDQTVAAVGVTVPEPQPFSNTKDVVIYNTSESDPVRVSVMDLAAIPARGTVTFDLSAPSTLPQAGQTITIGGVAATAVVGPRTSGADDWSIFSQAELDITVNVAAIAAGTVLTIDGIPSRTISPVVLTGAPGGGGAGTFTFDSAAAGANNIAAAIVTGLTNNYATTIIEATAALNVITLVIGTNVNNRGSSGNAATFSYTSTTANAITPASASFAGGVDAIANGNATNILAITFVDAINDAANTFAAAAQVISVVLADTVAGIVSTQTGAAGNATTLASTTTGVTLSGANLAGGTNAPTALSPAGTLIPPESSFTFNVGPEGNRQPLNTDTFWATNPGSKLTLALAMESGGPADVNITYIQNRGFTGIPST